MCGEIKEVEIGPDGGFRCPRCGGEVYHGGVDYFTGGWMVRVGDQLSRDEDRAQYWFAGDGLMVWFECAGNCRLAPLVLRIPGVAYDRWVGGRDD